MTAAGAPGDRPALARRIRWLRWLGRFVEAGTIAAALVVLGTLAAFVLDFAGTSLPVARRLGWSFLTSSVWAPNKGVYGAVPAIAGTLVTSAIAMAIAIPLSLGFAIFLAEFAPVRVRSVLTLALDVAAGIPSIVFGYWGFLVLVPYMKTSFEPALVRATGGVGPFAGIPTGLDVLTASLVLAAMIIPTATSLSREALASVPKVQREAAYSLGATRWEATRLAVLRPALPGLFAAAILALGRALGETVAVELTIGGSYTVPNSLLAGGSTLASQIAAQLPGAAPPEIAAIAALGLILLVISFLANGVARILLARLGRAHDAPRLLFRRRHAGDRLANHPAAALAAGPHPEAALLGTPARRARRETLRRAGNRIAYGVTAICGALCLLPLYSVVHQAIDRGGTAVIQPSFYTTASPPPCVNLPGIPCELGGIGPAIEGTLIILAIASAIALPVGILAGLYLAEFGRGRISRAASYVVEVMAGIPSILIGVFVFLLFVEYDHNLASSAYSAGFAVSLVMLPISTRATEEALRAVPIGVREAALALGFPRARVALRVVLGCARRGIVTGALLATARAAGETAAVLFTAGAGSVLITNPSQLNGQIGTLPTLIYTLGQTSYGNWERDAWGAALVLLIVVFLIALVTRLALRNRPGGADVE